MKQINGKIDENDLDYVVKRRGIPLFALPVPYSGKKINPHVSRFFYKDGSFIDVFHIKPIYYETIDEKWRPLSEVTYGFGNHWAILREDWDIKMHPRFLRWWMKRMELIGGSISFPAPHGLVPLREGREVHFLTLTVYPDPSPTTTSVDGFVYRSGVNETWATIRAGAGTGFVDNATAVDSQAIGANATATSNQWSQIVRSIYLFDTSSLGNSATISAATNSYYVAAASLTNISLSVRLVTSTPASNTALAAADYGQLGTVAQATVDPTTVTWSTGQPVYYDFTLNATGRGNISKTGITKFGIKAVEDADNTAPTWVSNAQGEAYCHKAEAAGTANDPKLVITYTVAAGNLSNLLLLGVG